MANIQLIFYLRANEVLQSDFYIHCMYIQIFDFIKQHQTVSRSNSYYGKSYSQSWIKVTPFTLALVNILSEK